MTTVSVLVGLQASGKTTFAQTEPFRHAVRVSKDDFPNARNREARQTRMIRAALATGKSVVADNTNATPDDRAAIIALAREAGARVTAYWFPPDPRESWRRNASRAKPVPEQGMRATLRRLSQPTPSEGFDVLYAVAARDGRFIVEVMP